jgi:hypothetical protein
MTAQIIPFVSRRERELARLRTQPEPLVSPNPVLDYFLRRLDIALRELDQATPAAMSFW